MNNYMEIMEEVQILLDMIENSELRIKYNESKKMLESESELISEFNNVKAKYEDVTKYGKHHPDFKDVSKELIDIKTALYNNDKVKSYKDIEKKLLSLSKEISSKFSDLVETSNKNCSTCKK